ncbi:MAG: 4a-hydroxytetrahydrobiopterin dehydratase [Acidimicrobiales bacterium]
MSFLVTHFQSRLDETVQNVAGRPRLTCVNPHLLTAAERHTLAEALPSWTVDGETLRRRFQFASFTEAMAFVSAMVEPSETLNHHPTWTNTYNRVDIELTTHDAGGLSDLDVQWAKLAERAAAELTQHP